MKRRLSSRSGTPPCPPRSRPACIVVLSALISFSLHSISFADETAVVPSRVLSFVEALHAKGYYDTAIDYLDRVEAEQNFDTELRAALFLERGNLLRDLARTQLLPGDYEPTQKLAREAYRKFITVFPSHDKYPEAATEIAQLRQQEIRAILLRYRRAAGGARESFSNTFRETAKTIRQEIAEAEAQLRERMEKFPKFIDKEESPDLFEKRRRTETGLVNMQLQAAILLFDEAEIASSDEQKRLTNEALKAFENLVANFRSNLVGMYAQLYVGRCQLRLQKATAAQGIFREMMLIRAEDPQVQSLVDEAHLGLLQSLAEQGHDKKSGEGKLKDLIQDADRWLKDNPELERTRTGQGVRWEIAKAWERLAEQHTQAEDLREENYERALAIAHPLSQQLGEFQLPAASMATQLAKKMGRDLSASKDFTAAFFECMNRVKELETLADGIEQAETPDERRQLLADMELKRPSAILQMQQALSLVRPDTPVDDIARVRYWLSYLYFLSGRDYESIVIGEYIGHQFADNGEFKSLALEASFMAVLAYAHAYQTSPPHTRDFEVRGLTGLCEFLDKKWPGDSKTEQASLTLGRVLADQNRPEQAVVWFEKIGEQSPLRLEAQLSAATAYWNAYLRALTSLPRTSDGKPKLLEGALAGYPELAHSRLIEGIRKAEKDLLPGRPQGETLLLARLTLAQIENQQGRYQKARDALLEGANSLIPQLKNHPPEEQPRSGPHSLPFTIEAHRQWLRAAIGLQNLEDALVALDEIGKLDGGGGKAADLYVAVGQQFSTELDQWRDRDARKFHEILSSFETFLIKLAARPESRTSRILLWIGESWMNLAENQGDSAAGLPYLERASTAFDEVLKLSREQPDAFTPEILLATEFRRVIALRRSGKFEPALNSLREILKQRPNAIDLQIEGARLMKDLARTGGSQAPLRWTTALQGEPEETPERLWGWGEISTRFHNELERNPGTETIRTKLFESRLEIADCRYQSALTPNIDPADRKHLLTRAAADVQFTSVAYDLPEVWQEKYDRLWKEIHSAMGIPAPKLPGRSDSSAPTAVVGTPNADNPAASTSTPGGASPNNANKKPGSMPDNAPLILFGIGAVLAIGITIYLNRPRKRESRSYLRG